MNWPHYVQVLTTDSQILPVDFSSHNHGSEKRVPRLISFSCPLSFHRSIVMREWILVGYPFLRLQIVFVSSLSWLLLQEKYWMCIPALIKWVGLSIRLRWRDIAAHRQQNPYFKWLFSRDRSCPSSMCWRFSRKKNIQIAVKHTYVRTYIFFIFIYRETYCIYIYMCNMIILELISFFNHHLKITFGVFAQGTPFSKRKIKKKVALKKGATRFRISPVTVSTRLDRHVSIVPISWFSWRWKWWFKTNPKQGSSDENMIKFILYNIQESINWFERDVWVLNYSSAGIFVWKNAPLKFNIQIPNMSPCFKPETHFLRPMSCFLFGDWWIRLQTIHMNFHESTGKVKSRQAIG